MSVMGRESFRAMSSNQVVRTDTRKKGMGYRTKEVISINKVTDEGKDITRIKNQGKSVYC